MEKHTNTIIAPHGDDEIIGCFSLLHNNFVKRVIYPKDNIYGEKDFEISQEKYGFDLMPFDLEQLCLWAERAESEGGLLLAPDPIWEYHPKHKIIGNRLMEHIKTSEISNVVFYSTNMNAPYIQELPINRNAFKELALDECYPNKRTLWQYDHKYFLFEGYISPLNIDCIWKD